MPHIGLFCVMYRALLYHVVPCIGLFCVMSRAVMYKKTRLGDKLIFPLPDPQLLSTTQKRRINPPKRTLYMSQKSPVHPTKETFACDTMALFS